MDSDDLITETCSVLNDHVTIITQFPQNFNYEVIHIIAMVMSAILSVTTVCLNVSTVITIWKTSVLKEKPSNFAIMVQSTVDLVHGTLVMPLFTYLMIGEVTGEASCYMTYVCKKLASLIFLFSLTAFCMMNHERYMGICYPIIHRTRMTKLFLLKFVAVGTTLQILGLGLALYFNQITRLILGSSAIIFLAHTAFVYTRIGRVIISKGRVNKDRQTANSRSKLMRYLREIKATKTCFIVVLCCIASNLPPIVTFTGMIGITSVVTGEILKRCFAVLLMLNSSLNSIIFFWGNKKLRIYAKTQCKARM